MVDLIALLVFPVAYNLQITQKIIDCHLMTDLSEFDEVVDSIFQKIPEFWFKPIEELQLSVTVDEVYQLLHQLKVEFYYL